VPVGDAADRISIETANARQQTAMQSLRDGVYRDVEGRETSPARWASIGRWHP
jgi:hypothetical protein